LTAKLRVEGLAKVFGPEPDQAVKLAREGRAKDDIFKETGSIVAVDDVSFAVPEREIFVVMGLSGSGKSTLIRCLNRLIEPTSGRVFIDDDEITGLDAEGLRRLRLSKMAMVFQHFALFPHRTVAENAAFGLKLRGMDAAERRRRAIDALDAVGLAAWADSRPASLSGGMQQRVGLARALAVEPEILLMDEPFSALDPLIRRDMQDELLKLQERYETTIVFITHDLHEALKIGDQVAIMKDGAFVQVSEPEAIVNAPADDYVGAFVQDVDRGRVLTLGTLMREASLDHQPADGETRGHPDQLVHEVLPVLAELARKGRVLPVVDDAGEVVGVVDPATVLDQLAVQARPEPAEMRHG